MSIVQLKTFLPARLRRCRETMRREHLAAFIVSDPVNVSYLTGFSGDDSVLILTPHDKILVTDSRFTLQARQECGRLRLYLRREGMTLALLEVLRRLNLLPQKGSKRPKLIGIEADHLTVTQHQSLRKKIGQNLIATCGLLRELRLCKDAYEIDRLRTAIKIAQDAMTALKPLIKPGCTEQGLAARLDYEMAIRGAAAAAFPSIAAVGPHAAQPHAIPGLSRVKNRSTILFDWGAAYQGYRSDLTRCWVVGKIPPDFAEAYRIVLDAQLAAIQKVKPGAAIADVDAAARACFPKKFPVYGHGTGHGIGLNIHEGPALGPRATGELRPGMVITVEPGIYLPGKFGIRIEDNVQVTDTGHRLLSNLAKGGDDILL